MNAVLQIQSKEVIVEDAEMKGKQRSYSKKNKIKNIIGYFLMACSVGLLLLIIFLVGPFTLFGFIMIMLLSLVVVEWYEHYIKK